MADQCHYFVDAQKGDDSVIFDGSNPANYIIGNMLGGAHITTITVSAESGAPANGCLMVGGTSGVTVRLIGRYNSTNYIVHGMACLLQAGETLTEQGGAANTALFGSIVKAGNWTFGTGYPGAGCYWLSGVGNNGRRVIEVSAITGNIYVGDILQEETSLYELLVVADLGSNKYQVQGPNGHQLTTTRKLNVLWRNGVTDSAPFSDFCTFDAYDQAGYQDGRTGAMIVGDITGAPTLVDFVAAGATIQHMFFYNTDGNYNNPNEYGIPIIDVVDYRDPYSGTTYTGASLIPFWDMLSNQYDGIGTATSGSIEKCMYDQTNTIGNFILIKNWGITFDKPFEHINSPLSIRHYAWAQQYSYTYCAGGNFGIPAYPCFANQNKYGACAGGYDTSQMFLYFYGPVVIDGVIGPGAPATGNGFHIGKTGIKVKPGASLTIKNFESGIGIVGLYYSSVLYFLDAPIINIFNCNQGIDFNGYEVRGISWCKFIGIKKEIILDLRMVEGGFFVNNIVYNCGANLTDTDNDPLITVNDSYELGVDVQGQSFFNNIFSRCWGQIVEQTISGTRWGPNTIANKMGVVDYNVWHDLQAAVPVLPDIISARDFDANAADDDPLFLDETNNLFVLHEKSPYLRPNGFKRLHRGVYGEGVGDSANAKRTLAVSGSTFDDTDLGQTLNGATASDTSTLRGYGSGYLVLDNITGKFNNGDSITRGGHSATVTANLNDAIILYWDNIANGPFVTGAGLSNNTRAGSATIDSVGDDYLILSSITGQFLDGDQIQKGATTADVNGDLISSTWKIIDVLDTAGPGYGWVESTNGSFDISSGIIRCIAAATTIETLDSPVFTLSNFATNQERLVEFLSSFFDEDCYDSVNIEYDNPGNEIGKIEGTGVNEFEQKQFQIRLSDTEFFQDGNLNPGPGSVSFYECDIGRLPRYIETLAKEIGIGDTVYFQIRLTANKNI